MSAVSNVVAVPYMGTTWLCKIASRSLTNTCARITDISISGHWIDAAVALDSLFLHRLETALHAMPNNVEGAAL